MPPSESPSESPSASPSEPPWGEIRYWVGSGATDDWLDSDNWTDDVVGMPGAPIPTIDNDVYFEGITANIITTGDITCRNLIIYGNAGSVDESTATILDLGNSNLTTANIVIGYSNIATPGQYQAKIRFGTGVHIITNLLSAGEYSFGYIEFERSNIAIAGNIDLRYMLTVEVESTVTLAGSGVQSLYFGGSEISPNGFGNLVINKPSGHTIILDNWYVANFIGVKGDFDINGCVVKVGHAGAGGPPLVGSSSASPSNSPSTSQSASASPSASPSVESPSDSPSESPSDSPSESPSDPVPVCEGICHWVWQEAPTNSWMLSWTTCVWWEAGVCECPTPGDPSGTPGWVENDCGWV